MKAFGYLMMTLIMLGVGLAGCSGDDAQTVDSLNAEAMNLFQAGLNDQALAKAKEAVEKSDAENGPDHPNSIVSLEIIGLVYQSNGDAGNAEIAFLKALSIAKKSASPESPEVAKITNNLAGLYYAQNQYEQAASFFMQSLAIMENQIPENDPRLAILRKNIKVCEDMQNGVKPEQSAGLSATADEKLALASEADFPVQSSQVNLVQDLVPMKVKDAMISQLAQQNIIISELEPRAPVRIGNKGMVFPYRALKSKKDMDAAQEIIVLFAAITNPKKPNAVIFQQCRLISHTSYLSALNEGGAAQLEQEIREVFPNLYL